LRRRPQPINRRKPPQKKKQMEILSTVKSYTLGTDNTTYFEVVTVTYDDESQDVTKRRVGPAAELARDQADKIEAKMRELLAPANIASKAKTVLNEAGDADATILALTAVSPLKVIQDRYVAALTAPGWAIDEGAGFVPLVFSVSAQGNLRYTVNGGSTKNATIYGPVIRLKNYPASPVETDFYLSESGNRFFSLPNRAVVIKKP
jgi:hypothetical protein